MQINRALSLPKSHVMFIANTGTSTKEVMRLVVHTMKGKVYTPAIFDGYSIRHFTNDLKACLNGSAFDKAMSVFCMEEYQLIDSAFYEYINSLLAGVFPSNLYTAEEIKAILSQLEDISFEDFKKLVFENFRFALIIDPRSSGYQSIIKSQPMFTEACSILSVGELSENILNDMTPQIVSKIEAPEDTAKILFGNIAKTLDMSTSDFPAFIMNFNELSKKKSDSLAKRKQFLSDGLLRLNAVASKVNQLSKEADAQRAQVEEKEKRANEAMNEISKTMTELTKQQDQMDVIQQDLTKKEGELSVQREEIDKQLADIKPTLQAASEKVSQIRPEHLSEIKSFTSPPPLVRDVLTGVVLLLGNQNVSWAGIKQVISGSGFLMSILRFDPHNVTNKMINDVENFIKSHMGSFDREQAERSSAAAAPLSQWVKAMVKYCAVIQRVQPLENKMKELDDQLVSSRNQLKDLEQKKVSLNKRVIEMQEQFKEYTAEAEKLRISLTELEERTKAASSLLNKLGDEQKRWASQVKDIEKEVSTIQPRLIMSAAFMTICGSMNETERSDVMKKLAEKLELKEPFSFTPFMNTQSKILEMKHNGFPSDDLSVENAQIIQISTQRPLFVIDPTEHVVEWLQSVLGPSAEVLSSSHPRFQHQVTLAIRFGKKLIIREADKVPLCLYPFLNREFVMSNGHLTVCVGDKFIDVHPDFRLIIVTRDAAIKLTAREKSLVSLVNFTVTKTALKAQLLTLALTTEMPELEEKHQEQLNESEQLKIELGKLEEGLLEILGKANPDTILQNKELIQSLDDKKKRAVDVENRLKQVEEFQKQIEEKRSQYQMLADVSSSIYFAIENLHLVHPMYKFSLNEFTKLFISTFSACQEKEKRVKNLILTFNSMAYSHFSRALFREHRLVFGMQLLKTVYPKMFPEPEYQHLLRQKPAQSVDGIPQFIPAERRQSLASLNQQFPDLVAKLQIANNDRQWMAWLQSNSPEMNSEWPQIEGKSIQELGVSQLQKILILQALRPDRVIAALEKLVISTFKNPRILSLREVMTEETENCFVFIVTPGSDPSIELKEIAMEIETVGENNFIELALGECDSQEALSLVKSAARGGQWAVIKNVHLDIDFLQQLEKTLPSLAPKDGFKLILTTEATTSFPNVLLQSSAKIAYEAPPGLINQMKRTLTLWNEDWFSQQPKRVRQALVSLAHLHGTLQERRAFIPVGWSQFFEFTQADLNAASQIIVQRCESTDVVRGLIEMTVYGGPMDSPFDRRVLSKFIERAFPARKTPLFAIPDEPTLNDLHEMLAKSNAEDGPGLLELAPNANATIARSTLVSSLKLLAVLSAASGGDETTSNDHFQQVEELSKTYPSALEDVSVSLANHPAIDFLTIQRAAAHKLARSVKDDLQSLSGVVDASLLPAHLRAVSGALQSQKVPADWDVDWLRSEDISEWLEELFSSTAAVDQCAMRLKDHNVLTSQPVPLKATIRPAAFVMALMQTAARMNNAEMDNMMLTASFNSPPSQSYLTINVCDIAAQVAVVSGGRVTMSKSPNNDIEKVEKFFLSVMPLDRAANGILLPVFESIGRDRLVCKVLTPCDEAEKDALVLSSAAFVLTSF
ncbi:Dynein heavy chain family protein [Trichomonas vaginalis G3]|uniref:Dynein heavy chain family protein n=1 Tax=Trichomonas vaginalis (strain ATCC PRA-98 / G3) TaxID=412133 RepID=A2DUX5_TRIV3|nr:dynein heavy chain family protein family [Trichomonas vaginalis G3]EAY15860.1 Dynein heavy chain family protein [Trichomonas vaginalis G3]KAI5524971.1 dynein heavy chain family protein family [Trichomonas vaginalis G3]|eukprot:XP_001328083.1 Dynein heavy chain family protein [Trichomonas vaginalis G3]